MRWCTPAAATPRDGTLHVDAMTSRNHIPRPTVKRLSLYLRELETHLSEGESTVSSRRLGNALGITDAQVRRDLGHFGQFGQPGIGYSVGTLIPKLKAILKIDRGWNAAVVGVGNIGRALLNYPRFESKGFRIVAAFDCDQSIVGGSIGGCTVHSIEEMQEQVREQDIRIGILAVPEPAAQAVADALVEAGIRGILNFTPIRLDVGDAADVVSVDVSRALEQLAYLVSVDEGIDENAGQVTG